MGSQCAFHCNSVLISLSFSKKWLLLIHVPLFCVPILKFACFSLFLSLLLKGGCCKQSHGAVLILFFVSSCVQAKSKDLLNCIPSLRHRRPTAGNWICKVPIRDAEMRGWYTSWDGCLRVGELNPLPKKRWRKTLGSIWEVGLLCTIALLPGGAQKLWQSGSLWQNPVLHRTVSGSGWGWDWGNAYCSEVGKAASRRLNLLSCSAHCGISLCFHRISCLILTQSKSISDH